MFLSKLILNPRDRQVRPDLARPYEMHKTLWNCFPSHGENQGTGENLNRILFRVDTDRYGSNPFVLVQSEIEPDSARLPAGYLASPFESKPFEPSFTVGQCLRFRLRANPTKKIGTSTKSERIAGTKKNGKRVALFHESDRITWLLEKGQRGGFTVPGGWIDAKDPLTGEPKQIPNFRVDVIPEGHQRFGKEGHRDGELLAVRFDGILIVTDSIVFRMTLQKGIGSAKGFGFGLLSIAPAEAIP